VRQSGQGRQRDGERRRKTGAAEIYWHRRPPWEQRPTRL